MIDFGIQFSRWQQSVYSELKNYRFVVISAGRQSGKTHFCVVTTVLYAMRNSDSISWWVAPIYDTAKIAFRRIIKFLISNNIPHSVNKSELRITLGNNSTIWFKSSDKEDSLRGETVNFMVIDEMGVVKRASWEYALRGTVTVTNAQVIFIGTPKGKNLFYDLFIMGQDRENKEFISFQFSSNDSPFFSEQEWVEVQKLPQRVFQQEYQAQFIDDGGEVFRNVRGCISGSLEECHNLKKYFSGVDLAKSYDYTVICVLDDRGHLCAFDRFNDVSWTIQKKRIINLCTKYDSYTIIDSTGLGDPILDDLSMHIKVDGYKFTNISKRQLIESLAMSIERGEISFPDIPELINELNIFSFEQGATGTIKYSAPDGMHDDIVISLALAHWIWKGSSGGIDALTDIGEREMINSPWD